MFAIVLLVGAGFASHHHARTTTPTKYVTAGKSVESAKPAKVSQDRRPRRTMR